MTLTLPVDPIDPKIESNGPRIITKHPTKFQAIQEDLDLFMTLTLDPIDPKIESNGPRIITKHPTKCQAIQEDLDLFMTFS